MSLLVLLAQAGKFNMIPTLINMVAAFTSVGVVSLTVHAHTQLISSLMQ